MKQKQLLIYNKGARRDSEYYAPCINCIKHPHYPQAPITLHRKGRCLICQPDNERSE